MRKISRQRKWQIKQQSMGNCIICGKKAINKYYCLKHQNMIYDPLKKLVLSDDKIKKIYLGHLQELEKERKKTEMEINYFSNLLRVLEY